MDLNKAIERLRNDEDYYGDFGKQFLSNSNIQTLLSNPANLHAPSPRTSAFLVGGYFHTAVLEPGKLDNFKIIKASNRNTKAYKEASQGELCLLESEADMVMKLKERLLACDAVRSLVVGDHKDAKIEYEVPNIIKIGTNYWKGKADIVNHDEKLIIDLKTTNDVDGFKWSAKKYNYDSQAFIYSQMFGYEFLFIAIDKNTMKIKFADCSPEFYERGAYKVEQANEIYDLHYKDENFEPNNFFITETL
jgi:hypothetical protein